MNEIIDANTGEIISGDWYALLVDDCKAIVTEAVFTSRWALVEGYHALGERIVTDENYQKEAKGNYSSLQRVAKNIGVGERTLYYAIQFYEQYPVLNDLPGGKNVSWRKIINELLPEQVKNNIQLPDGKYRVIYADPPWEYDNSGFNNSAESQYPTMSEDEISNLDIDSLSSDSSVLFIWATNPLLDVAMRVMKSWGFEYKTNFVWIKDKARGFAWWAKSKHELLLVGTKENSNKPIQSQESAIKATRPEKHSQKPEEFYLLIESMFPEDSKIELFSRNRRDGWASWGNQL